MQIRNWWFNKIATGLIISLSLFAASGSLNWPMAWVYALLMMGHIAIMIPREHLSKQSMAHDGTKKWDLLIAPFVSFVGPLTVCLTAGLNRRFGWATFPLQLQYFGLFLMLLGTVLSIWAVKANAFYTETVRIEYERQPVVISGGPYRFVRHPGYAGHILASIATPLMLGTAMALIPSACVVLVYIARTFLEDITLQRQFKGYYDYTKKVRHRLFPGIW